MKALQLSSGFVVDLEKIILVTPLKDGQAEVVFDHTRLPIEKQDYYAVMNNLTGDYGFQAQGSVRSLH